MEQRSKIAGAAVGAVISATAIVAYATWPTPELQKLAAIHSYARGNESDQELNLNIGDLAVTAYLPGKYHSAEKVRYSIHGIDKQIFINSDGSSQFGYEQWNPSSQPSTGLNIDGLTKKVIEGIHDRINGNEPDKNSLVSSLDVNYRNR